MTGKKGRGELKAGGVRTDNRYDDERNIRLTGTVQGNVQGRKVVEVEILACTKFVCGDGYSKIKYDECEHC